MYKIGDYINDGYGKTDNKTFFSDVKMKRKITQLLRHDADYFILYTSEAEYIPMFHEIAKTRAEKNVKYCYRLIHAKTKDKTYDIFLFYDIDKKQSIHKDLNYLLNKYKTLKKVTDITPDFLQQIDNIIQINLINEEFSCNPQRLVSYNNFINKL